MSLVVCGLFLRLPITVLPRAGYRHLSKNSAAMVFWKNDALHFEELERLGAEPEKASTMGAGSRVLTGVGIRGVVRPRGDCVVGV